MARILVVDDSEKLLKLVRHALIKEEHYVFLAENAYDATGYLGWHPFDLFILEINMPRMNGLATVRDWLLRKASLIYD